MQLLHAPLLTIKVSLSRTASFRSLNVQAVAARPLVAEPMLYRACSTGAEVDRPQDATSENGVTHARVSQRELCEHYPGPVEPGEYHPRSCLGFSPCRALASKGIEQGRWRRFPANAHAPQLREPVPRSSRIARCNLLS